MRLAGLLPVYALFFLTGLTDASIVPVLPLLSDEFGLSHVEVGALLAVNVLLMLVVCFPVGLLVDRIGAKPLVVLAAGVLALAALGQALAVDFWTLLAARAVFGIALGTVWTAGTVVLARSARGTKTLSAALAVSGAAILVGSPFGGFLAELFDVAVPFALIAVAAAMLAGVLLLGPAVEAGVAASQSARGALGAAGRERRVLGAVVLMGLLGFPGGITNLLIPLRLDGAGFPSGEIGAAFSVAGVLSILASTLAGRVRDRRVGLPLAGAGALLLGLVWLVPIVSVSAIAAIAFVAFSASLRSPLNTAAYMLGRAGAAATAVGTGGVFGRRREGIADPAPRRRLSAPSSGRAAEASLAMPSGKRPSRLAGTAA